MGVVEAVVEFRQKADRAAGTDVTDDDLVARVRAGDDAAFEHIYDRYARGLLAFCLHMMGNRETAEDALQLTFVSAYRALRTGEDEIALRPWLYTIARNRCLSELRARRDVVVVDDIEVDQQALEGVVDQVQRREDLRELIHDMQRLPADQRAALVLFELGDHSHQDIAAVLGVRTPKVKALIFQAREGLVRGRQARERPCAEIRERLATSRGTVLPRSMTRAHIDRCPSCAAFEYEVTRQRAALGLILPVALAGELKAWVLGSTFHTGGTVVVGAGACAGGGVATGAYACSGGAVVAGGASSAGAASGAGAVAAVSTTGIAGAGTGAVSAAVAAAAPMGAAATGLTAVGEYAASVGAGGLGGAGVVAKVLTAAVIAAGVAGVSHPRPLTAGATPPAALRQILTASARPAPAPVATPAPATLSESPPPVAKPPSVNGADLVAPAASGTADPADSTAPEAGTADTLSDPGSVTPGSSSSAASTGGTSAAPAAPAAPASASGASGGAGATSSTGVAGASASSGTAGATTVTGSTDTAAGAQTTSSTAASGTANSTASTDATGVSDPSDTAGSSTSAAPADASDSSSTATSSPPAMPADASDPSGATDSSDSSGTTTSSTSAPAPTDSATDPTTTSTTDDATASPTTGG